MKKILCFGDSNTWGHDPENDAKRVPDEYRWARVLNRLLGEDYIVIEDGLCGRWTGSTEFVANDSDMPWNGYQYFLGCFRAHRPLSLVAIMLGTNDMQGVRNLEPEHVGRMLKEYVNAIKAICAETGEEVPEVLFISPITIADVVVKCSIFDEIFGAQSIPKSEQLAGVIEKAAKECGAHYLNAQDYATASECDGIHMDSANHVKLARAVYEKIEKII